MNKKTKLILGALGITALGYLALKPSNTEQLAGVMFWEEGNQPIEARRLAGCSVVNRTKTRGYPETIPEVISDGYDSLYGRQWLRTRPVSWTGLNWPLTKKEASIYQQCREDAKYLMQGKRFGIAGEDKVIAFRNDKKTDSYFNKLNFLGQYGTARFFSDPKAQPKERKK